MLANLHRLNSKSRSTPAYLAPKKLASSFPPASSKHHAKTSLLASVHSFVLHEATSLIGMALSAA